MKPKEIFLRRLKRQKTPRVAIGSATSLVTKDLMEKIGVGFPEAHLDAEKMAQLALATHTVLGYDNVMPLFSVWHESAALGCPVEWGNSSRMPEGKSIYSFIDDEIKIPANFLLSPSCQVPLKALKKLSNESGNDVAIMGKVFGPWTLAYHLFGVEEVLVNTLLKPDRIKTILKQLVKVTITFANAQIDSGADALTLCDHCTRDLCSPETYKNFLFEIHQELHNAINCPLILHICGDTSDRIPYIRETNIECFHFDSKVPAVLARKLAGDNLSLMGGTSNINIVLNGTEESIVNDIRDKISANIDIIGPECAVPLNAPYKNLKLIVETARSLSKP